jgi:NAD(P)H-flavin reductase
MVLDPTSDRDLLMVGIGTGLAPLKGLVQQVARLDVRRRVDLFVVARDVRGLYDLPALQELAAREPWLTVTPVVSEQDPVDGQDGRVEHGPPVDVVLRHGPWGSRDVYLSGARPQVRALRDALVAARVPAQRVKVEEYTPSTWSGTDAEGAPSR